MVRELTSRGHQVRYYSFERFREAIEETGAEFISCDCCLPPLSEKAARRMRRVSTTEMTVRDFETTARMDAMLSRDVESFQPDGVVSDSVCFWGKLTAQKHHLPFICSTTTFAFNRYSSRSFQPCGDTFSDCYAFVGPSIRPITRKPRADGRRQIYVSLGTVLQNPDFYQACIEGLRGLDAEVILSVGRDTDPAALGPLPENMRQYPFVDQLEVLSGADVFITHCGMNSVSESLSLGVPLVLCPQTNEQRAVARRAEELGAGLRPMDLSPAGILSAVTALLENDSFRQQAEKISREFHACPGPAGAADFIEKVIS